MTYLELCQSALGESETGSPEELTSLRDADIYQHGVTRYVAEAWRLIQLLYDSWGWRQQEFNARLVPGVDSYRWNVLHDGDEVAINRSHGFRTWLHQNPNTGTGPEWRISQTAENDAATGGITPVTYQTLRLRRLVTRSQRRPSAFAISPKLELLVSPPPDEAYRLYGMYVIGVQQLTNENEVPVGLEEEYHDIIKWRAIMMIHGNDEADKSYQFALGQYEEFLQALRRVYLPQVTIAGSLV